MKPAPVTATELTGVSLLGANRILRSAGVALLAQVSLHGQLAWVEWGQEKNRLLKMLLVTLLGFAALLCAMLAAGVLLLSVSWDTAYRIPAVLALLVLYALGAGIAWRRFVALSALSSHSFAATREEFAADIALLKSTL